LEPTFRTSGLSSGIDTLGLVDKLIAAESRPLALITKQQASISVQISSVASLSTKLDALKAAATGLKTSGVAVISPNSTYADFTVGGAATAEGRYGVRVETLARAGKLRTNAEFASTSTAATTADELHLKIDGVSKTITGLTGKGLGDVAAAINQQLTSVTASVISTGTGYHLSIARKDTGFVIGQPASSAIELDAGFANPDAGLGLVIPAGQEAVNAKVHVDGVQIERSTNEVANAIPGVTLSLKAASNTNTDLVFAKNGSATTANVQKFVDAFNDVSKFLRGQLRPQAGVTKAEESIGGSTLIGIQGRLQGFLSVEVNTTGAIRTLGNLGLKLQSDGTVLLDQAKLDSALAADPEAVNAIFQKATTGLGTTVEAWVKGLTNGIDGTLTGKRRSLEELTKRLDDRSTEFKRRLEARKEQLIKQFTAMEKIMSNFSAIGNYLQSQKLPGFSQSNDG
jgi:flagellar hook-associated protein 2